MNNNLENFMKLSIDISKNSVDEDNNIHPKVGAVLIDNDGNILATSYRGEYGEGCHCEYSLFQKLKDANINYNDTTLFVTLEPCTKRGPGKKPCSQWIVEKGVSKVYIGMLDPNQVICGKGEFYLRQHTCVERYPHDLIGEIQSINNDFVNLYGSNELSNTSLFATKQIADIVKDHLTGKNIKIDIPIDNWDFTLNDLINYCSYNQNKNTENIKEIIEQARSIAYDKKYGDYNYENDIRGLNNSWKDEVKSILKQLNIDGFFDSYNIIDVGEGNGLEAESLFNDTDKLTLVNISQKSLDNARSKFTYVNLVLNSAENLYSIDTSSKDIYISLRVYQSSFFNIDKSIEEAYRVLKPEGVIIISIANGFVGENNEIIHGLLVPGSNIIDINRPYLLADKIRKKLSILHFSNINIFTGFGEIFIFARRK